MKPVTTAIPHFSESELACKSTGTIKIDPRFAEALPKLREAYGKPMVLNSACRTPAHNIKIGGYKNSLHLTENQKWPTFGTMACDVKWRDWSPVDQECFARLALKMGWRVRLHNGFCHIDRLLDISPDHVRVSVYDTYTGNLLTRLTK